MALEATFRTLFVQIGKLCDTLNAILLTVGDRPPNRGAALVDGMENTILDMLGTLQEARTAARAAERAVASPMDLDRARRSLAKCQDNFHQVERQFANELVSYERLKNLAHLGSERGGEWKAWAGIMKSVVEECRQPVEKVGKALVACWHELAERLGMTNVSVNATNIGQQITTSPAEVRDIEREGVT
jgi:hypothetical protein